MIIETGKQYLTKSGNKVVIELVITEPETPREKQAPVRGQIYKSGTWLQMSWAADGSYLPGQDDELDLIEIIEKFTLEGE